ncbi:MAG: methyltransferase domain-containing protein [Actinobacteria bacterium]|nr:methyltransferase domain-containing protein [Actinomycetota bacterium]
MLDVGCGTGRLCAALLARGSRVTGVEPSPEMLAVARARLPVETPLVQGRAEELPFPNRSFERAAMSLVVHLVDRGLALPELRRVLAPGGRAAILTFDPASFANYYLCEFFPSIRRIDEARFPVPDELAGDLRAAGFATVRTSALSQAESISREEALDRIRGRHISTFQLIGDDEYRRGMARAEHQLPDPVEYVRELVLVAAS